MGRVRGLGLRRAPICIHRRPDGGEGTAHTSARCTMKGRVCGKLQGSDMSKHALAGLVVPTPLNNDGQGVVHMLCPASSPSLQTSPGPASPPAARAAPRLCMVCRPAACVWRLASVLRPHLWSPVVPPRPGTRDRVASLLCRLCRVFAPRCYKHHSPKPPPIRPHGVCVSVHLLLPTPSSCRSSIPSLSLLYRCSQ
jgi:hypothetical protein